MAGEEEMRSRARGGEKRRRTKGNTDEADTERKMAEKKHHAQTQTQGCALPPFVCCTLTLSLSLFPPNTHTHTHYVISSTPCHECGWGERYSGLGNKLIQVLGIRNRRRPDSIVAPFPGVLMKTCFGKLNFNAVTNKSW